MNPRFEWQFGGVLRHVPAPWAAAILLALFAGGVILIFWLYRHTLRNLSSRTRFCFAVLRAALLLALMVCLANPSRVERAGPDHKKESNLAVIVDRSGSMSVPDNRGETRLAHALRIWSKHTAEAESVFKRIDYFRFSSRLEKINGLKQAASNGEPGGETRLYTAIQDVLAQKPIAIVCLTDGLDTTGTDSEETASAARRKGIPVYFVAASNRIRADDSLAIREIKTPPQTLRNTEFSCGALLEIVSRNGGDVPVELWSGKTKLAEASIPVRPGMNTIPWSTRVPSHEPGLTPLEFRLGKEGAQEIASSTVRVVERTDVNILYYQGALQWGYHFLFAALQADPSFHLTGILNPALHVKMSSFAASDKAMFDLPETAADLSKYQIIVLAHVFADQLTARQQQALADFANAGGAVLFIAPDSDATTRFAGTTLEKMLPVVFEGVAAENAADAATQRFQNEMKVENYGNESMAGRSMNLPVLQPFTLSPTARTASLKALFSNPDERPMFCNYARVRNAKPAAEVLAMHPENGKDGVPRVLLARQQYGNGFTAVLATDLLWRWKMTLPSTSDAAEKFWQNLMLSLAPAPGLGPRLVKAGDDPVANHPATVRVEGAWENDTPRVFATSPSGVRLKADVIRLDGKSGSAWLAYFTPDAAGRWLIEAQDSSGIQAGITLNATQRQRNVELTNMPADLAGMQRLAQLTGGALIGDGPVFHPVAQSDDALEIKRVKPLWNTNWLIGLMLGIYGMELILRRIWKLL